MALSKQPQYSTKDQIIANIGRAHSHSARVKILKQLAAKGECCVQEIGEEHPISKATPSNHLRILREAHLVNWYEQFPYTFYSLNDKTITRMRQEITNFLDQVQSNFIESN